MGSPDVKLILPHRFGEPDLGFLWRGLKGIVCVGGNGCRYVGIGVTLDQLIVARRSLRRLLALILVGRVLPIFICLAY